jgi:hypothetical protein
VADLQGYNIGLTPSYGANQQLTNGVKRNVGHVEITADVNHLYNWGDRARGYLHIDHIFSTDAKDKGSQMMATWGIFERSLASSWFIPIHLEEKLQGDQEVRYSSSVTSLGLRSLMPWKFTRPTLYNAFVQAPVPPLFQFDVQYEQRMPRIDAMKKLYPRRQQQRTEAQMSWTSIQLLPQRGAQLLCLEIVAKGWYLPWDQNSLKRPMQRLEGNLEASLLVPLTRVTLTGLNFVTDDKAKASQRIRVKYVHGANEVLGFIHSSQLSLGLEVIK